MADIFNLEQFKHETLESLKDTIKSYADYDAHEALIPVLYEAQKLCGYLPYSLQRFIAEHLDIPSAHVNGVVTFYAYFTETPRGEYTVSVCTGTACHVKGADKVIDKARQAAGAPGEEMSDDGLFSVNDVRCIGACGLAPVITVNGKVHGKVDAKEMEAIINRYKEAHND